MDKLSQRQSALLTLAERYVERQKIVYEAMSELRPDHIMRYERRGDPKEWAQLRLNFKGPYVGLWGENSEWHFRLHGIGCHLTHTKTGEVIGWDVAHPKQFDWHWFTDHLDWLFNSDDTSEAVEIIRSEFEYSNIYELREFVKPILDDLANAEYLRPMGHHYRLVEQE